MRNLSLIRLTSIAAAAAILAGCASRPKPVAEAQAEPPAPAARPPEIPPPPPPPPPRQAVGSLQQRLAAEAGDRVYFELDSYRLNPEAQAVLDRQAAWLIANPAVSILIAGNCDERGTREYNIALGARRAQATADYLVARGVPASRLRTISYGKERPIDPGSDEQAWARNRNAHTQVEG